MKTFTKCTSKAMREIRLANYWYFLKSEMRFLQSSCWLALSRNKTAQMRNKLHWSFLFEIDDIWDSFSLQQKVQRCLVTIWVTPRGVNPCIKYRISQNKIAKVPSNQPNNILDTCLSLKGEKNLVWRWHGIKWDSKL